MRSFMLALALLGLTTACKSKQPPSPREVDESALTEQDAGGEAPRAGQTVSAAGVELTLPADWTIVDEHEDAFAMASAPRGEGEQTPVCTIELRRQGPGPLPPGAKRSPSSKRGEIDYTRGRMRGRLRELPGPSEGASVVVHCRAPKAGQSGQWGAIEAAFESLKVVGSAELPAPVKGDEPIVDLPILELCTGTPSRRTYVCVRRRDGAVFCGESSGETLTRVAGIDAAAQLSCEGARACVRDAAGHVSCWAAGSGVVEAVAAVGQARDLAGGCIVDERGKVACRRREVDGSSTDMLAPLAPFGEDTPSEVEQVLAGSNEDYGCVVSKGALSCWDRKRELPLALDGERRLQVIELPSTEPIRDLARFGERVCVADSERWTCLEGEQRFVLEGCSRRPCGCSLIGASRLSCEHEPHERIDARPLGRITGVVATDGPCAALVDGSVICRGPVTGKRDASPRTTKLVAGGAPGVAHTLELRE